MIWDSGTTHHMSPDRSMFSTFRTSRGSVRQPEGSFRHEGIRTISFVIEGRTVNLENSLFCPTISNNLFSHLRFKAKGGWVDDRNDLLMFKDRQFCKLRRVGNLLEVPWSPPPTANAAMSTQLQSLVWHQRFAHANLHAVEETLKAANDRNLPDKLPEMNTKCVTCGVTKSTYVRGTTPRNRRQEPFDLVHADSLESNIRSRNDMKWMVVFVDDTTGMFFQYCVRQKSDVFEVAMKPFLQKVGTQFRSLVHNFKIDKGTEFGGIKLEKLAVDLGVGIEGPPPYHHHMNGVAERATRTVEIAVRAMLRSGRLPGTWWDVVSEAFCYIHNRTWTSAYNGVPILKFYEFLKQKVNFQPRQFKVCGCRCFVHIPKERRAQGDKWGERGRVGKLVGYVSPQIWKVWVPVGPGERGDRIIESGSVTFDEFKIDSLDECRRLAGAEIADLLTVVENLGFDASPEVSMPFFTSEAHSEHRPQSSDPSSRARDTELLA